MVEFLQLLVSMWPTLSSFWKPKICRRYVNDVFVIWPHGDQQLEEFHRHLNELNPPIQFMIKKETEGKIAFLDLQIENKGAKVHTSVFRKRHT